MSVFRVLPYSIDALVECLKENSLAKKSDITQKLHKAYFSNYFQALKAKTIVVEPEYFDHDFIEDYAAYYVRCYHPSLVSQR